MNEEKQIQSMPSPFARALKANEYTKGKSDYSVTQLVSPPQRTFLAKNHPAVKDEYASFMALLGTAVHAILEKYCRPEENELAEIRNFSTIEVLGDEVVVSGQMDYWENRCLYDYKVTGGVQEVIKPEHYKQVQLNANLAIKNGIECEYVGVVYFQRDWKYMQSKVDPTYPKTPIRIFIHPYDHGFAEKTLLASAEEHHKASLGEPRKCTLDEQWAKPDTYAVKKPDAKRARRVYDSHAEAAEDQKPGEIIEKRPGEKTFCQSFCGFAHVCPQYQAEQ
jgi:hypothetical protein